MGKISIIKKKENRYCLVWIPDNSFICELDDYELEELRLEIEEHQKYQ